MITCPNLKELYGDRFKVEYEPSYYAEHGQRGRTEEPWLMVLLCQRGHICPWGPDTLAASTNKHGPVAKRLAAMDCCRVVKDASDGITVTFALADFETIAAEMKPRRRRKCHLSQEQRERFAAVGRKTLANLHRNRNVIRTESDSLTSIGGEFDSQAVQGDLRRSGAPQPAFTASTLS